MATTPKVYVICDSNCKWEGMTKEQILTAIMQAVNEGTIGNIDAGFVQTIKTINGIALKFFMGTQADYDLLSDEDKEDLFAIITNDTTVADIIATINDFKATVESCENTAQELNNHLTKSDTQINKNTNNIASNLNKINSLSTRATNLENRVGEAETDLSMRPYLSSAYNKIGALVMVYKVEPSGKFGFSLWETVETLYRAIMNDGTYAPFAFTSSNTASNYSSEVSSAVKMAGKWVCLGATYKTADGNQLYLFQRIE